MLLIKIRKQLIATILALAAVSAFSAPASPQNRATRKNRSTPSASFRLTRSVETPGNFNLMVSDGEETVISGSFTLEQVQNFRDIMAEARSFALTNEEVGSSEPRTTRFFNEEDPALIVDVMKFENQSQLFITYQTEVGRITVEGGTLDRTVKKEAGLFYDLLQKIESMIAKK